eukprot:scaffold594_cov71-Skeletonema_dohrnii-CCMP3373.AAC.4
MTGTPSTAMAQSHHKKESATTSNTLPTGGVETTATFSPVTDSSDDEVSSLSSQNGVKRTLLKVTPRQLSFPNKAKADSQPAVITAPTMVGEHTTTYKRLSVAGEHFARKQSEGEHISLFSRLASKVGVGSVGHTHGDAEAEDEAPVRNLSAAGEHFARKQAEKRAQKAAKKAEKEESAADQSAEVDEEDLYKNFSAAGAHFARKKAEKKARRASKEEAEASELSNADGEEIDDETDRYRYRHLSAAGEHFARKKSDGESTSLFNRMRSNFTAQ